MSRAFVKDDGSNAPEDPLERQPSGRPNYVTVRGLAWLEGKVAQLNEKRASLAAEKSKDQPRDLRLRQTELDLRYYAGQLERAILVDHRGLDAPDVRFGAVVSVREPDGTVRELSIVGEDEADAEAGKLNWASPLADALLGKKPGSRVAWARETGETTLEVVSVLYPKD